MTLNLNSQKDHATIREVIKDGVKGDFWRVIVQALNKLQESLQAEQDNDAIKELPAEQYKLESEIFKAKRKYLKELADFPATLLEDLEDFVDNRNDSPLDPY